MQISVSQCHFLHFIIKITNPKNGNFLIANVKSNKVRFSNFYNAVLSPRIAKDLDLDLMEPYVEIVLIPKGSTFVAKKAKTFDEERSVAEKAPIDGIQINDLNKKKTKKKIKKQNFFSYSIKVADFYYKNSAILLVDRIKNETSLKNLKSIKNRSFEFSDLLAKGLFLNVKKYQGEKTHSLKILLDKLKKKNIMPGLCDSNELIARDEGMHTEFACMIKKKCTNQTDADLRVNINLNYK